jgi:hypothetical protein
MNGLIALLPIPLEEIRVRGKGKMPISTKSINQMTIQEDNGRHTTPSELTTSRPATINPSDNYEMDVDEELPPLVSDADSDSDSEDDSDRGPPPLMSEGDDDSDDDTFHTEGGKYDSVLNNKRTSKLASSH